MIGVGSIGSTHLISLKKIKTENLLSAYKADVKIKGVADIDESKLNNLERKNPFKIEYFTTNPEEILNDKAIDIIYITTPTKFHKDFFLQAAEQGKNVFCEKPLAFSLEDIKEMIAAKNKYGILTQVGLVLRHCPIFWKLKQILSDNSDIFGNRLTFSFRDTQNWPVGSRIHPSEWRKNPSLAYAGCLYEHSIHDVDILEYLFSDNAKLTNLYAKVRYVSPMTQQKLEDVASIKFEYEDGLIGDLTSIWNHAKIDERRLEIFFENSYVVLDGYTDIYFKKYEYMIGRKKTRLDANDIVREYLTVNGYPQTTPTTGHYLFENLNFLKSMIKDEKPYPGLEVGYRAHKIIELAYQSSQKNKNLLIN